MQHENRKNKWSTFLALLLFVFIHFACQEKADLIIHNATIYTLENNQPRANSIVISNGIIKDIGNDLLTRYDAKNVVDAKSLPVFPGFIDAHSHFLGLGLLQNQLGLRGTKSAEEIISLAQEFQQSTNQKYIVGFGWDQNQWEEKTFPHKSLLDQYFSDIPVFLYRVDGHALWVNQKAIDIAGIDSKTTVEGGVVVTDSKGPTGVLVDNAMALVTPYIPKPTLRQKIEALQKAEEICFS